jgi:tetratricopeptide (TPR) repeat protein
MLKALAALAALAAAPAGEEPNDTVHLLDNSATNVLIVEDSWREVGYKVKVENVDAMRVPVNRVKGTEYADRPAQYDQGMDALRKGEYDKAEKLLVAGLAAARDKKQHQYFLAGLIDCCQAQRKYEDLRKYARKMAEIKPAARLIYEARLKLGDSYLREAKYGEALKAFDEALEHFKALREEARKTALPGVSEYVNGYRLQAGYWRLFSMEREAKDANLTGRQYDIFSSDAKSSDLEIYYLCRLGYVRCRAAADKPDEARQELAKVQEEVSRLKPGDKVRQAVMPAVQLALGDLSYNQLDYRQARWYYLKVIVQFATDRASVARAHVMTGMCYEKLRDEAREKEAVARALRHYQTVVQEHQDSVDFAVAKERLDKLKGGAGT